MLATGLGVLQEALESPWSQTGGKLFDRQFFGENYSPRKKVKLQKVGM
jgi:hypothetical protein